MPEDDHEYIENFEKFLSSLEPNMIAGWEKLDDKTYAIKVIKSIDYINLNLNLCQENQKHL